MVSLPRQQPSACATTQPFPPYAANTPIELPDTSVVLSASVILVVAAEFGVQGFLLLVHRLVPVLLTPVGDGLQPSAEPFGYRLHMHYESTLSVAGAKVLEAEEIEGFGLLPLFLRIPRCIAPELNQPRLLRVQSQAVLLKPLRSVAFLSMQQRKRIGCNPLSGLNRPQCSSSLGQAPR